MKCSRPARPLVIARCAKRAVAIQPFDRLTVPSPARALDCFVATAPRNDKRGDSAGHAINRTNAPTLPENRERRRAHDHFKLVRESGNSRTRMPVAAKIALHTAGATGGSVG